MVKIWIEGGRWLTSIFVDHCTLIEMQGEHGLKEWMRNDNVQNFVQKEKQDPTTSALRQPYRVSLALLCFEGFQI